MSMKHSHCIIRMLIRICGKATTHDKFLLPIYLPGAKFGGIMRAQNIQGRKRAQNRAMLSHTEKFPYGSLALGQVIKPMKKCPCTCNFPLQFCCVKFSGSMPQHIWKCYPEPVKGKHLSKRWNQGQYLQ